jgi:Na+/H+ antiporter NhaD/arsenite permease-like protein
MSAISAWVAVLIFLLTFGVILTDFIHRTTAAWIGAVVMLAAGLLMGFYNQRQALAAIDFNTLGLLLGMMILMAMLKETGVFEYLAIVAAQRSAGDPWRLLVLLGTLTAVVSMLLNNVTVIILIAPVTLVVAGMLHLNPVPFLVAEAVLSNLGGTATLIGDPPNTIIGSAAGFTFNSFLVILLPIVVAAFYPTLWSLRWAFRAELRQAPQGLPALQAMRPTEAIKNWGALRNLSLVMAIVVVLFILQDIVPLQQAYVAFIGVAIAMLVVPSDPEKLLREVEWSVLLFFACLFVAVGGLEAAGIMHALADYLAHFASVHIMLAAVLMIWIAALLSGIVDNIPFTIAMVPVLKGLEAKGLAVEPLWWALALGVGFGGNATPIGASANIVAISMSEQAGWPIPFRTWLRSGLLATVVSCVVGTLVFVLIFGVLKR